MSRTYTREEWLGPASPPARAHVVLTVPAGYGTLDCGAMTGVFDAIARGSIPGGIDVKVENSSALCLNFNRGWAHALNGRAYQDGKLVGDGSDGITHFAMMHTDICPLVEPSRPAWLSSLWDRIYSGPGSSRLYNVVSVTSPIKSNAGLSSTGLDTSRWNPRRLSMGEIMALPDVLDNDVLLCGERLNPDLSLTGLAGPLLINTGLWLADIRGAWADHIHFDTANRIVKDDKGVRSAEFEPEDWRFSRDLYRMGVPYCAVKDVHLNHMGPQAWTNYQAWGQWDTDKHDKLQPDTQYVESTLAAAKLARESLANGAITIGGHHGN